MTHPLNVSVFLFSGCDPARPAIQITRSGFGITEKFFSRQEFLKDLILCPENPLGDFFLIRMEKQSEKQHFNVIERDFSSFA
jgi:hypothetical protein